MLRHIKQNGSCCFLRYIPPKSTETPESMQLSCAKPCLEKFGACLYKCLLASKLTVAFTLVESPDVTAVITIPDNNTHKKVAR